MLPVLRPTLMARTNRTVIKNLITFMVLLLAGSNAFFDIATASLSLSSSQEHKQPKFTTYSHQSSSAHQQIINDVRDISSSSAAAPNQSHNLHRKSSSQAHVKQFKSSPFGRDKEFLTHDVIENACRKDRGCQRRDRLNNTYLYYCTRHKIDNLLSNELLMSLMHDSEDKCATVLDSLIQLDDNIHKYDEVFTNLIRRYNSPKEYSVKWGIKDCTRAYLDWLCTINLPYYMHGERVKPCISFCERVEQRCPYLHPITKEQYGGQPVFICRDPNIPLFVPSLGINVPYSETSKCYDLCHLNASQQELEKDSLSKYGTCPDQGSLAVQVCMDS